MPHTSFYQVGDLFSTSTFGSDQSPGVSRDMASVDCPSETVNYNDDAQGTLRDDFLYNSALGAPSTGTLGWLPEWAVLAATIRALPKRAFWEIFAGTAGLTLAFSDAGWCIAPPVDIDDSESFDLLNPLFISVVVGLILEGRISLLHLAPPCSSFAWALNRFVSLRLRSVQDPGGLPDLSAANHQKVRLGNALCDVACRIAAAQHRAKGDWELGQPASPLMLKY